MQNYITDIYQFKNINVNKDTLFTLKTGEVISTIIYPSDTKFPSNRIFILKYTSDKKWEMINTQAANLMPHITGFSKFDYTDEQILNITSNIKETENVVLNEESVVLDIFQLIFNDNTTRIGVYRYNRDLKRPEWSKRCVHVISLEQYNKLLVPRPRVVCAPQQKCPEIKCPPQEICTDVITDIMCEEVSSVYTYGFYVLLFIATYLVICKWVKIMNKKKK